jgi:hypothetical protein
MVALVFVGCAAATDFDRYASGPVQGNPPAGDDDDDGSKSDASKPPKTTDAGPDAPSEEVIPAVVQTGTGHAKGTIQAALAPAKAGNLLVVAIANEHNGGGPVKSITDNVGNGYVSADARSSDGSCDDGSEIWFAKDIKAGATTVTVTMTNADTSQGQEAEVWVIEASGLSKDAPLDAKATSNNGPQSTTVTAPPVTPTVKRALVVSTATACEEVKSVAPPFTGLTILEGEGAAWLVTTDTGSFGAVWTSVAGTFNASTVAFKP